jgi:hypothetical protein
LILPVNKRIDQDITSKIKGGSLADDSYRLDRPERLHLAVHMTDRGK